MALAWSFALTHCRPTKRAHLRYASAGGIRRHFPAFRVAWLRVFPERHGKNENH